ncbi:hypothetical protein [Halobacillus ihumii]|uniref:hypothetical protein n=1 Tax=Halobacillus ihumii TaxID=2686092 RepID=UPI0013D85478|nr:hypothetical protein [Halobacillus ihumii]
MAGYKSSEGKRSIDKPSMTETPPRRPVTPKKKSAGKLSIDVDCSDALTGLKAVQREAKKATGALREFEDVRSKSGLTYNKECPECGDVMTKVVLLADDEELDSSARCRSCDCRE